MKKLLTIYCILGMMACSEDPSEAPALFTLEAPCLETSANEGSNSENIKDVWVFQGGVDVGVFPLPATIPIIQEEEGGIIQISAGVRNNGINSTPIIYPFYQAFFLDLDLTTGTTENLDLCFEYADNTKFAMIEDFETGNIFTFDEDGDSNTSLTISGTDVRDGLRSGHIHLEGDEDFTEVATSQNFFDLPMDGTPIFMEMDYKTSVELNVGLIGFQGNTPAKFYKLTLREQEDWNKAYIDFTFDILNSGLESYKILFGAALENPNDTADVYLDNIKLLHF